VTLPGCFALQRQWIIGHDAVLEILERTLPWSVERIRMFGRTVPVPRATALIGEAPYTYSGIRHTPAPWDPMLAAMRDRLERELGIRFNSCLANFYRNGRDSVAWHADDEPELGERPTIASVSLGDARAFVVRRAAVPRNVVEVLELGYGDLLVMRDESQADYQHCVFKTSHPVGPRINLTFRSVRV